ncbi:MAG TPA: hypothetical protein VKP88_02165, partial [Candidatus Paceibacterota bacterium]|nr:hypothetical protein [Candidatus Paceibacterota bacterium]
MSTQNIGQRPEQTAIPPDAAEVLLRDGSQAVGLRNRRWSLTNILVWLRSKFGTAVDSDVTTSATDTTAGRLTRVGDFGWGLSDTTTPSTLIDVDATDTPIGMYLVSSAITTNTASLPAGFVTFGSMT